MTGRLRAMALGAALLVASPAAAQETPRALLIGDSNMYGSLGKYLETSLTILGFEVVRRGKPTSGLARPDFFNWFDEARRLLEAHRPQVVIMVFGGNDGQGLAPLASGLDLVPWDDEAAWRRTYGERVTALARQLRGESRMVFVLSPPNRSSANARAKMERIVAVQRASARAVLGVEWIDLWKLTSDPYGRFLESGVDGKGRVRSYRKGDGIHLTGLGSLEVGHRLVDALVGRGMVACHGDR
jgi:hypothetical protein